MDRVPNQIRIVFLVLPIVVLSAGSPAFAQSAFVQGAYGPDIRRFSGDESDRVFDATVRDVSLGLSGFMTPLVTAGIELDVGGTSTTGRSVSLTIAGRPATVTTRYTLERRTVSALAGLHTSRSRRVQLGVYAGLSFSRLRRTIASDAPAIVLSDPPEPSAFTDRSTDPVMGADVAVRIAPHLAVTGGIRAHGITLSGDLRGFAIRPRAGVRVSF